LQGSKQYSLSNSELSSLKRAAETLKNAGMYHASSFSPEEFSVMYKISEWPKKDRFPGKQ
jgi:hypothetical protein